MNQNVTRDEVRSVCDALRLAGIEPIAATRGQIVEAVGVVDRRARTIREWIQRSGGEEFKPDVQVVKGDDTETSSTTFDSAYASYKQWIGMTTAITTPAGDSVAPSKIVVAGDFHCPFHHKDAVKALIEEEAGDTDLLVINGDLLDCWGTSRFPKSKRLTDPCSEMAETQALLVLLASKFKRIKMLGGNHDARPKNYLTNLLPPDILDYINLTGPMVFNPLKFLAQGLGNVELVNPIKSGFAEFPFLYQIGDLVCTHAEVFSTINNKATGTVNHWIRAFAIPEGIISVTVRAICQGHSHQGGSVMGDYGVLCIEGGCMSQTQDYHGSAKIQSPRPVVRGWSVVYQNEGVTDQRHSRFIPFHG